MDSLQAGQDGLAQQDELSNIPEQQRGVSFAFIFKAVSIFIIFARSATLNPPHTSCQYRDIYQYDWRFFYRSS